LFQILGAIGLILFLGIELLRSIKMFKIMKWEEAFLTPFFDCFYYLLFFAGIFESLIRGKLKPVA
jgi:hypothetical protein